MSLSAERKQRWLEQVTSWEFRHLRGQADIPAGRLRETPRDGAKLEQDFGDDLANVRKELLDSLFNDPNFQAVEEAAWRIIKNARSSLIYLYLQERGMRGKRRDLEAKRDKHPGRYKYLKKLLRQLLNVDKLHEGDPEDNSTFTLGIEIRRWKKRAESTSRLVRADEREARVVSLILRLAVAIQEDFPELALEGFVAPGGRPLGWKKAGAPRNAIVKQTRLKLLGLGLEKSNVKNLLAACNIVKTSPPEKLLPILKESPTRITL